MKFPLPLLLAVLLAVVCSTPAQALSTHPWEGVDGFTELFTPPGDTLERRVTFLRPPGGGVGAPAVFVLHFNEGSAASMANLVEAGRLARDENIWVILPIAADGTWDHNPSGTQDAKDSGFLAALIEYAVVEHGVDPKRVYMTGYSQGGNMSLRVACEHPGKLAAVASVAATMRTTLANECAPLLATPILFMNGTADNQVLYDPPAVGACQLTFTCALGAVEAAQFWASINGCTGAPVRADLPNSVDDGTRIYVDRYSGCAGSAVPRVEQYTVVDGGHSWPGALDFVPRVGLTTQDVRALDVVWQFFQQFSRP